MTTDAHRVSIDPSIDGSAPLPEAPTAGLVVVSVPAGHEEACGVHVLDFARRWRDEGRRVYLGDACFEAPFLHAAAGVANGEGLTDSLLYGTSFGLISHRIEEGIALAPAGTVVGDADAARAHGRWATILSGFEEAGALLVVVAPSGAEGPVLSAAAATHIDFGEGDLGASMAAPEPDEDILAAEVMLADAVADGDDGLAPDPVSGAASADPVDDPAPEATAAAAPEPEGERLADPPPVELDAGSGGTVREAEKRRSSPLLLVLLLVIAAALGLGYFGIVEIPGITPTDVGVASDLLLYS